MVASRTIGKLLWRTCSFGTAAVVLVIAASMTIDPFLNAPLLNSPLLKMPLHERTKSSTRPPEGHLAATAPTQATGTVAPKGVDTAPESKYEAPTDTHIVPECPEPAPELQVTGTYRVAIFLPFRGAHEHADAVMIREGIVDHPALTLEPNLTAADIVLWISWGDKRWEKAKPNVSISRLVLLDFSDGTVLPFPRTEYSMVFKRSFVRKRDGVLIGIAYGCNEKCFSFGYGVMNRYVQGEFSRSRPIKLMCTLRPWLYPKGRRGAIFMVGIARNRVLYWLHRWPGLPADAQLGSATKETYNSNGHYMATLRKASVVVTANPAGYEGDHRLWEHFAVGNAVMSDQMYTPLPFAPVAGVHYIDFENWEMPGAEEAFREKIGSLLQNPQASHDMACRGYQHALRHHRSVSRVDYVVRSFLEVTFNASFNETGKQLRKTKYPLATPQQWAYVSSIDVKNGTRPPYFFHIIPEGEEKK